MTGTLSSSPVPSAEREISEISVGAILLGARDLHQLQVVHHDEIEPAFALQAARTRTDFRRRECRSFVLRKCSRR